MPNPVTVSLQLATPIANGAAQSQSLASATTLTLNGTLASSSVVTFDVARRLAIQSAGNDSTLTWTVAGTDRYGNTQSETIAGVSVGSGYTKYDYKTVTSIRSSGATGGNVIAGSNGVGSTPWFVREFLSIGTMGMAMEFAATNPTTSSIQITLDDPNAIQQLQLLPAGASVNPQSNVPPLAWEVVSGYTAQGSLSSISSNTLVNLTIPFYAWRMTQWTGTSATIAQAILTAPMLQGGPGGVF